MQCTLYFRYYVDVWVLLAQSVKLGYVHILKDAFVVVDHSNPCILLSLIHIISPHMPHIVTQTRNSTNKELEIRKMLGDSIGEKSSLHKHKENGESMSEVMIRKDVVMEGNLSNKLSNLLNSVIL